MKKRIISLLIASLMIFLIIPVTANAAEGGASLSDWVYTVNSTDGTVTLNRYISSAENVTVPGSFDYQGQTYTAVVSSSSVFSGSRIKHVKVCSGAVFSGNSMRQLFISCTSLTGVDFSEADTSCITDMSYLFCSCFSLTSFDLSSLDTSGVENMSYMFYGCSALAEIDFTGAKLSKVTNMSNMFYGCSALSSIGFSDADLSGVCDMSYMFCTCSNLTDIDFSGIGNHSLDDMRNMFSGCTSLTQLDLSPLDTSIVTSMSGLFSGCTSLTDVDFSGLDTSHVTDMSNMFSNCTSLTQLDLSELNTECVTTISSMFDGCTSLSGLNGYENWNTSSLKNMSFAFNKTAYSVSASVQVCIDLSRWDLSNISNSGWCFQNCLAQQIILPDNIAVISAGLMNHAVRYAGTYYTIPSGVKRIGYAHTFYDFATNSFTEFRIADGNTAYKAEDGVLYSADSKEMLAVPRNKQFENGVFEILEGVEFLGELSFSRNYNIHTVVLPDSFEIKYVPLHDQRYIIYNDTGNINAGTNLSIAIYCYTGVTDYAVKATNPRYASADGIIYSKDMTHITAVPARYNKQINIPEGVTHWDKEAMWADSDSVVDNLMADCAGVNIPSTMKTISPDQVDKLNRLHKNRANSANPFNITVAAGNTAFTLDTSGCLCPVETDTFYIDQGDVTFSSGSVTGYDANGNLASSSLFDSYTVTQRDPDAESDHSIIIKSGSHKITLDNVNVKRSSDYVYGIQVQSGAGAEFTLEGENHVTSGANYPGLEIGSNASVTIQGSGSLYSQSPKHAGIGSSSSGYSLTINSGTVYAASGYNSAGIISSSGSAVTINGGVVTAVGGNNSAGIGAAGYTNHRGIITINGGTVTAVGGDYAAGIGGGNRNNGGTVIINGGTVKAVPGLNAQSIGNGYNCSTAFAGVHNSQGDAVSLKILDTGSAERVYFNGIGTQPLCHHPDDSNYYFYTCASSSVTAYDGENVSFYTGEDLTKTNPYSTPNIRKSDYLLVRDMQNVTAEGFTFADGKLIYCSKVIDTASAGLIGDANLDGNIDGEDSVFANCICAGLLTQSSFEMIQFAAADYDTDGEITQADVSLLEAEGLLGTVSTLNTQQGEQ